MATQEFFVSYWDKKYLDSQFPERENIPLFQINVGDVGSSSAISRPENFPNLALDLLKHLKKTTSLKHTYQIRFNEDASTQIGETGKQVLEEILALHNDLVTPRRS